MHKIDCNYFTAYFCFSRIHFQVYENEFTPILLMLGRANKKGRCRTLNYYSLLNTPVIQYPSGRKIGTVSDIFLKENSTEIFGIVATNRSLIYQNRLYAPGDIIYTGTHEVSVFGPGVKFIKAPKEKFLSFRHIIGLKTVPAGSSVSIGTVKDGFFDMEAGSLTELLIGKSIADDIINGRKLLRADSITEEHGLIKAENPALLSNGKGLKALGARSSYDKNS